MYEDENDPEVQNRKRLFSHLLEQDFSKKVDVISLLETNF